MSEKISAKVTSETTTGVESSLIQSLYTDMELVASGGLATALKIVRQSQSPPVRSNVLDLPVPLSVRPVINLVKSNSIFI